MTSCNYHLINDGFTNIGADLQDIALKLDNLDVSLSINELDVDLDNLEQQLIINNKLMLLNAIGTDIMSEEDQVAAYTAIKEELFASSDSTDEQANVEEGN